MSKKPNPLGSIRDGQMRLIALLMYLAKQKQKNQDAVEQLFRRLMLPGKE